MSIIYISTIIALSSMGIGYAAWNSGLHLDTRVETGYIKGSIEEIDNFDLNLDDGEWISFDFSDDNQILRIKGEVYPSFSQNIPLRILDQGSVPVYLKNMDLNDADITKLIKESRASYRVNSYKREDIVESFKLNISPDNGNGDRNKRSQRNSSEDQDEISNLQDKLNQYDRKEDYQFKYEFLLEQAL